MVPLRVLIGVIYVRGIVPSIHFPIFRSVWSVLSRGATIYTVRVTPDKVRPVPVAIETVRDFYP